MTPRRSKPYFGTCRVPLCRARFAKAIFTTQHMGPFFHQNLSLIGQTRQSMIDTDATCYMETVRWAAAVDASFPRLDGLIWTSHQHDRDFACVLFGDRVKRTDLHPAAPIERVDIGPGRARIGVFCKNYKIDILPP